MSADGAALSGDSHAGDDAWTEVLTHGQLELIGQVRNASNATVVCDAVSGDQRLRCVYKPIRGEAPLWDFPDGTLAGREVASFLISDHLGWDAIPTTVLRSGMFGEGMVQRWIETVDPADDRSGARLDVVDVCPPSEIPPGWKNILSAENSVGDPVTLVHADDPRLQRVAVLDVLINNADRKGGHVLEGIDGQIYGIDHGICLHREHKLRTVLWGWAGQPIPGHLLADVDSLVTDLTTASSDIRRRLADLITGEEIDALAFRGMTMIDNPVMPAPAGIRPIPWPPF